MRYRRGGRSALSAPLFAAIVAFGVAGKADAVVFSYSGPSNNSGDLLSGTAEFLVSGTTLTIVLTNTSAGPATDGADVLAGLFFNIAGNPAVIDGSAMLTAGSVFEHRDGVSATGVDLNREWMFDSPVASVSRMYGVGATGFPNFNPNQDSFVTKFSGVEHTSGANSDYGLIPLSGIIAGNFTNVYVSNSVTFTLEMGSSFSESDIGNVMMSFGSDGSTQLVPEPATIGALAIGALALLRRRRK